MQNRHGNAVGRGSFYSFDLTVRVISYSKEDLDGQPFLDLVACDLTFCVFPIEIQSDSLHSYWCALKKKNMK